jgi:hypothetical protein
MMHCPHQFNAVQFLVCSNMTGSFFRAGRSTYCDGTQYSAKLGERLAWCVCLGGGGGGACATSGPRGWLGLWQHSTQAVPPSGGGPGRFCRVGCPYPWGRFESLKEKLPVSVSTNPYP